MSEKTKKTILLADDDPDVIFQVKHYLEKGFRMDELKLLVLKYLA